MESRFSAEDVFRAYERIKDYVRMTPLEESPCLGGDERRYFFKLESLQTVKSFKIRGALSKMTTLTEEERKRGVATVSSGNHGASVAYAAGLLGIEKAVVVVPRTVPEAKAEKIRYYGGEVKLMGANYDEAHAAGMEFIEKQGLTFIDAYYDDPQIYAGQGTIAIEIFEQNPRIDTIVAPIGGGGLITGIAVAAKAIKPEVRIVGVQTEACPAMIASYRDNRFYEEYPISGDTVCDALVGGVGKLSFEMLRDYADDVIEVREKTIRKAVRHMILNEKFVVKGGSCTAVAAVMDEAERIGGKNVALIMSGGNIDGELIREIIDEETVSE